MVDFLTRQEAEYCKTVLESFEQERFLPTLTATIREVGICTTSRPFLFELRFAKIMKDMGRTLEYENQAKRLECYKTLSTLLENLIKESSSRPVLLGDIQKISEIERKILGVRADLKKAQRLQTEIGKLIEKEQAIATRLPTSIVEVFESTDPGLLHQATLKKLKSHSMQGLWLWLRLKILGLDRFKEKHNTTLLELIGKDDFLADYKSFLLSDELES